MTQRSTLRDPDERHALEARFALRVCAHLHDASPQLPADIQERLRFSRQMALEQARMTRRQEARAETQVVGWSAPALALGTGPRGERGHNWWLAAAMVVPVAVLVAGLLGIQAAHDEEEIMAAADIDAELLADDLPPDAYRDPAFLEYLKQPVSE